MLLPPRPTCHRHASQCGQHDSPRTRTPHALPYRASRPSVVRVRRAERRRRRRRRSRSSRSSAVDRLRSPRDSLGLDPRALKREQAREESECKWGAGDVSITNVLCEPFISPSDRQSNAPKEKKPLNTESHQSSVRDVDEGIRSKRRQLPGRMHRSNVRSDHVIRSNLDGAPINGVRAPPPGAAEIRDASIVAPHRSPPLILPRVRFQIVITKVYSIDLHLPARRTT